MAARRWHFESSKSDDTPETLALANASGVSFGGEERVREEESFGCQSASDLFEACRLEERREFGFQVGVNPVGARRQGGEERGS